MNDRVREVLCRGFPKRFMGDNNKHSCYKGKLYIFSTLCKTPLRLRSIKMSLSTIMDSLSNKSYENEMATLGSKSINKT